MIMTTITINNNYNMKRIVFAFLAARYELPAFRPE